VAKWPYSTPEWKLLRQVKLQEKPFCEPCLARNKWVLSIARDD
jgi:hypothetical protein